MDKQETIRILTKTFGGKLWEKHGKCRVYFEGAYIANDYGLEWTRYNTGNISSASLNGERISNSECRRILDFFTGKFWFDFADNDFHHRTYSHNRNGADIWCTAIAEMRESLT